MSPPPPPPLPPPPRWLARSFCLGCHTGRRLRSDSARRARGRAARGWAAAATSRSPSSSSWGATGTRRPRRASPRRPETRPEPALTSSFSHEQPRKSTNNAERQSSARRLGTGKLTSHIFFQRQPDCRPSAQGIVGVLIPGGPRFKIELVSARSREHCERHNSFSRSGKTVACLRAASYRRGLVSAAAARPLPRQPSPTRKPGADSPSSRTHAAAEKRSPTFRRPPALPRAALAPLNRTKSARGGRGRSRAGAQSKRRPQPALARCIPAANRWYLPSYTFHIIAAEL